MDMLDSRVLTFFILMHVLRASLLTFLSSHSTSLLLSLLVLFYLLWFSAPARLFLPIYLFLL